MDDGFSHSVVGRSNSFVKSPDAVLLIDLLDALSDRKSVVSPGNQTIMLVYSFYHIHIQKLLLNLGKFIILRQFFPRKLTFGLAVVSSSQTRLGLSACKK